MNILYCGMNYQSTTLFITQTVFILQVEKMSYPIVDEAKFTKGCSEDSGASLRPGPSLCRMDSADLWAYVSLPELDLGTSSFLHLSEVIGDIFTTHSKEHRESLPACQLPMLSVPNPPPHTHTTPRQDNHFCRTCLVFWAWPCLVLQGSESGLVWAPVWVSREKQTGLLLYRNMTYKTLILCMLSVFQKSEALTFGFHSTSLSAGFTLHTMNSTACGGSVWKCSGSCSSWSLLTNSVLPSSINLTRTLSCMQVSSFGLVSNTCTLESNGGNQLNRL